MLREWECVESNVKMSRHSYFDKLAALLQGENRELCVKLICQQRARPVMLKRGKIVNRKPEKWSRQSNVVVQFSGLMRLGRCYVNTCYLCPMSENSEST